jgi:hypothetical protein
MGRIDTLRSTAGRAAGAAVTAGTRAGRLGATHARAAWEDPELRRSATDAAVGAVVIVLPRFAPVGSRLLVRHGTRIAALMVARRLAARASERGRAVR